MRIKKIQRKNINTSLWDKTICKSKNRRIYALSWYLDAVTDGNWDAIIYQDYDIIMPLPFVKKYGFKIYLQPIFCQQLGIFRKENLSKDIVSNFIKKIPSKFFSINFTGDISYHFDSSTINFKPNYVLKLCNDYNKMLGNMSSNHRRNIKKAKKAELEFRTIDIDAYIKFKKSTGTILNSKSWIRLKNLLHKADDNNRLELTGAFIKNELISAVGWIKDFDKLIYLQAGSNEKGKENAAAFGLINLQIEKEDHVLKTIDFEGSSNQGIARFYKGFGAINESYVSYNSKLMKKLMRNNEKGN